MMDLSPNIRKIIAIALIILPILFFVQYILTPIASHYYENDEEIQKGRFVLSRYMTVSNQQVGKAENKETNYINIQKKNFFVAKNEVIASANIQSKLKNLAAQYGITVLRANRLAKRKQGELTLIGVNAELVGVQKNLHRLVHAIEKNKPFLFVQRFQLIPQHYSHGRKRTRDIQLKTVLHVYGAYWVGEGS